MSQPAAPYTPPPFLVKLEEPELHALDEVLQAGLAHPRHPILRDWSDVPVPLHRRVSELMNHGRPTEDTPR